MVFTGIIHGVSNQGGALLTIVISGIYNDKEIIRTNIAFAYLLFASLQFIVLLWLDIGIVGWPSVMYGSITIVLYLLVGRAIFDLVSARMFLLNIYFFYGALLLVSVMHE